MRFIPVLAVLTTILPGPVLAQVMQTGGTTALGVCGSDRVAVTSYTLSNPQPLHGQQVTLTLQVRNMCGGNNPRNIPWRMSVGTTTVASGTVSNLAAGQTATVTGTWLATLGQHLIDAEADPSNTLSEPAAARPNNLPQSITVNVGADWNALQPKLRAATGAALRKWFQAAALRDVAVNGAIASQGRLQGPNLATLLQSEFAAVAVPAPIASAFANGLGTQWSTWMASVKIPSLPWYPSLASGPPPAATSLLNSPTRMSASIQNTAAAQRAAVGTAIRSRLGTNGSTTAATGAVDSYAVWWETVCMAAVGAVSIEKMALAITMVVPAPPAPSAPVPTPSPFAHGVAGHMTPPNCS